MSAVARCLWLCVAVLLAGLSGCHCGCQHPAADPVDTGLPDAGVDAADVRDAEPQPDGTPTTWRLDAWVPADACDATTIELPPSGMTYLLQVSNMGRYVAYDDYRIQGSYKWSDLYVYDLETCTEHKVTDSQWNQAVPTIWGTDVVYSHSFVQGIGMELVLFDIETLTFNRLTTGAIATWAQHNSRHVAYLSALGHDPMEGMDLLLWDRLGGLETQLAEASQGVEHISMSETHVAWVAWGGPDKDVFFSALDSPQAVHVQSTWDPWVAHTSTWGDWVVWEDTRYGGLDIQGLQLGAQTETRLVDNGAYNGWPVLRRGVMCFRTSLWSGVYGDWDLAVHDLETGVTRRVTSQSHYGYKCNFVDSGWLVYRQQMTPSDQWFNKIWAVNLLKLGILDTAGRVIP